MLRLSGLMGFLTCQSPSIVKNITLRKLDLFSFSGKGVGDALLDPLEVPIPITERPMIGISIFRCEINDTALENAPGLCIQIRCNLIAL
jgi:hypothetical protein